MKKIVLSIDGMTCSACSNGLEKYLNKQNGIIEASVNLVLSNATIIYDESILNIAKLDEFVKKAGFKSLGEFKSIDIKRETKKEKIKFVIYSILAIILMYISMGHMINLPIPDFLNVNINPINYTICLFLFSIAFIFYGFDIIKNGYKNLIHKTPNMDTLVSIGVLSSFIYSIYSMVMVIKGNIDSIHNLYFESTAIVIYFIKLGRYLEGISKDKTKSAIEKLVKITPNNAVIKKDDKEIKVTLDEIHKGDIVICKPGEKVAVDGEILNGVAHFDESFITGESKAVKKTVGKKVVAGSINYDGYIEYKAEKIGKESTISEIVRLVIEASGKKAKLEKIADTVSGYFVPTVIIIAILTFLFYIIMGFEFSYALTTFVTILVVACPCSLGLATPLATLVSEGVCASNGILVKKGEILEKAKNIDTVVFDKTGTLTYGKLKISKIENFSNIKNDKLLQLVGSIESKSTHPISKAFEEYFIENNIEKLEVNEFENIAGFGIIGKVEDKKLILGNAKILEKYNIENIYQDIEEKLSENGNSIIYVSDTKEILALIGVSDIVRQNTKQVIKELNKNKIETIMLTGDNEKTAMKIANKVGINKVFSSVLPANKTQVIKELKDKERCVMMCGDGINDSPALANADIGVSVNSGTDIAIDSSDVILTKNNLMCILNLINISKKTVRNIKQNLFWAFFYNVLMIPIAMGVLRGIGIYLTPMIASIAMMFSSITVILNSLRLKNIKLK